jgi:hypothetical protein
MTDKQILEQTIKDFEKGLQLSTEVKDKTKLQEALTKLCVHDGICLYWSEVCKRVSTKLELKLYKLKSGHVYFCTPACEFWYKSIDWDCKVKRTTIQGTFKYRISVLKKMLAEL